MAMASVKKTDRLVVFEVMLSFLLASFLGGTDGVRSAKTVKYIR
jgi:hypothetical protein